MTRHMIALGSLGIALRSSVQGTGSLGFLVLLVGPLLFHAPAAAQTSRSTSHEDKGTFLGVLFAPRTEKLAPIRGIPPLEATTPKTGPRVADRSPQGVVVTHVLPGSPAARADLRRGDVLLKYDHKPIRDGDHLVQLIRDDKPAHKIHLLYQRGTRVQAAEATLVLGPALKLSGERRSPDASDPKQGSVNVWATPLESGKMKVTIEYYSTGKLHTLSCGGTAGELARTVQKLPERERSLVRIALQRLRSLNTLPTRSEPAPSIKR